MNKKEHLLQLATEECAEIIQSISKAQRFGMDYISPSNQKSNHDNIVQEFHDLLAIMNMLEGNKYIFMPTNGQALSMIEKKRDKVEQFMGYSQLLGMLE